MEPGSGEPARRRWSAERSALLLFLVGVAPVALAALLAVGYVTVAFGAGLPPFDAGPTATPTPSATPPPRQPTATPARTPTPTATASATTTRTPSPAPTRTPTAAPTRTATRTPTRTPAPVIG